MQCADRNFQAFVEDKFLQNQQITACERCVWMVDLRSDDTYGFACDELKSNLDGVADDIGGKYMAKTSVVYLIIGREKGSDSRAGRSMASSEA
ncbi:hypothetical protein Q3G72_006063 [Acer saccharum]|nr:hypothetical protein Q3G72_006063 [Acer saccharum]